jgi:nucleoside-diphosphate-sugar epimerase
MKKVLVTGSTGFIGKKLIKVIDGHIRVLSRRKQSNYETIVCNLEKESIPDNTLIGIDTVFHLAGFAHDLREADKIKNLYKKVNVDATVELAELAVKSGVKRFVFVSSVKAGGSSVSGKCVNETDQCDPDGIYGKTKREAELKLLEIGRVSGMCVSIIRPALVYGSSVKGHLQLMLSAIKNGWFPPLPETGNQRSMIHVDDLVRAILFIAEDKRTNGQIFIATDGTPYSARKIYIAMCNSMGKSIPKWSIPKILFDIIILINRRFAYKLDKLFGDECYSSKKLENLGFRARKTLNDQKKHFI